MKMKIVSAVAVLLVVLAVFGTGLVMAQEEEQKTARAKVKETAKEKKLLHRYDVFIYQLERHRIGMEAVIAYVDESGGDSTQLVTIKDEFVALEGELETAAASGDADAFQDILKSARDLTKDFKDESHSTLGSEGEIGKARIEVNSALEANGEYLGGLLGNIQQSRKEGELEIVDEANKEIKKKIDEAKEKGIDTEELEDEFEELEGARDELEEDLDVAIESCEGVTLAECDTAEAQEYKKQREEVKNRYQKIRETSKKAAHENRITKVVAASRRVMENVQNRISKAEEAGADVTVAKAKHDEVIAMLDAAETKLAEGDYEGALEELKNAKEAFKEAQKEGVESRREAVKERREEAIEKAKEQRKGASGDSADEVNDADEEDDVDGGETDEVDDVDEEDDADEQDETAEEDLNESEDNT